MGVDHSDGRQEWDRQLRRQKSVELHSSRPTGGGDAGHAGSGSFSIELGTAAVSSATGSTAVGYAAEATADGATAYGREANAIQTSATAVGRVAVADGVRATAVGYGAEAEASWTFAAGSQARASAAEGTALGTFATVDAGHDGSTAVGANSETTTSNQIMLGHSGNTVVVPGTFSNPSARRLKRNIIPAPVLSDLFPELVEYEYITAEGRRRVGYIADDLVGSDAERFVTFDDDGRPSGIDYLSLLVVQVAQLRAELTALKDKLGD